MPVPQKINFLVEQASCLFLKGYHFLSLENVVKQSQTLDSTPLSA
ncbi:hypothetical protein QUB16_07600 [Microcoleus sp. D3_18a_C4]